MMHIKNTRYMYMCFIVIIDNYSLYILLQGDESHKADEFVRYVKDKLPEAVTQCINAASEEYHPPLQQALLLVHVIFKLLSPFYFMILGFQSANFGKGFIGPDISDGLVKTFVKTCRDLRVLNTVRHKSVGIPITYRQYLHPHCFYDCMYMYVYM